MALARRSEVGLDEAASAAHVLSTRLTPLRPAPDGVDAAS